MQIFAAISVNATIPGPFCCPTQVPELPPAGACPTAALVHFWPAQAKTQPVCDKICGKKGKGIPLSDRPHPPWTRLHSRPDNSAPTSNGIGAGRQCPIARSYMDYGEWIYLTFWPFVCHFSSLCLIFVDLIGKKCKIHGFMRFSWFFDEFNSEKWVTYLVY
jgi:hypothetical protein